MADSLRFVFFYYDPSLAAAVIFVVSFGFSTIFHAYQLLRHRTWYFIPFLIGGLFEAIGYVARILAAEQAPNFTKSPYIMQSLLILQAPLFFAASIYMIFGRLIKLVHGEAHSVVPLKWITPVFVAGDVLSLLVQGSGGGILASASDTSKINLGTNIVIVGLIIQIIFFLGFIITSAIFHLRFLRRSNPASLASSSPQIQYLYIPYATSLLILVRNIARVVEYVQGYDGYMQRHEVFIYVLDALLMLGVMLIFNVQHPSQVVTKRAHGGVVLPLVQSHTVKIDKH